MYREEEQKVSFWQQPAKFRVLRVRMFKTLLLIFARHLRPRFYVPSGAYVIRARSCNAVITNILKVTSVEPC
jgi:hypothetical protein